MRALLIFILCASGHASACERSPREVEAMHNKYAGVLYDTWRRAGRHTPDAQLRDEAHWRAYYILIDNNMICRPKKVRVK